MSWRLGLGLLVLLAIALFAAQNSSIVTVIFLNSQMSAPLSILFLFSFVAGAISIGIISTWQQLLLGRRIRQHQSQIAQMEKELAVFRRMEAQQAVLYARPDSPREDEGKQPQSEQTLGS